MAKSVCKYIQYNFKKEQSIAKENEAEDAEKSIIRCYAEVLIFRQVVIDPIQSIRTQIFDVLNRPQPRLRSGLEVRSP